MNDPIFDNLLCDLMAKGRKEPHLIQAIVELTYGCNLRCVHCYNPTHEARGERNTEEVFKILEGLAQEGCLWVGFTGGELFTRRDALTLVRHAKRLGMVVSLLTNATLITSVLADEIENLEPYTVEISMYGATQETYEKVTRIPGSFSKFVGGLDILSQRDVKLVLKLVILSLNYHEFDAMREFSLARKIRFRVNTEIHPKVDGSREPLNYRITPDQAFEIWRKIEGDKLRERMDSLAHFGDREQPCKGNEGKLFDCACGKFSATVTPHGKMNLCVSIYHPQYDVMRGGVAEGWRNLVDLVESTHAGEKYECQDCNLYKLCSRGPNQSWLEEGVFDAGCFSFFREIARRKAEFLGTQTLR